MDRSVASDKKSQEKASGQVNLKSLALHPISIKPDSILWIDTDNAMGSKSGDIDDAVAILLALRACKARVILSAVAGNTSKLESLQNTKKLVELEGVDAQVVTDKEAENLFQNELNQAKAEVHLVALGPLTNLARWWRLNLFSQINLRSVTILAFNSRPWPTNKFFDFNVASDFAASKELVLKGPILRIIPCDLARKMRFTSEQICGIQGGSADYLIHHSKRWFRRALFLKACRSVPIWDLAAVASLLIPEAFTFKPVKLVHQSGWGWVPRLSPGDPSQFMASSMNVSLVHEYLNDHFQNLSRIAPRHG